MGLEYRIPFRFQDKNALHQALRDAPHLAGYDDEYAKYEYRAGGVADPATMPDATAAVEEYGFYFCEYGNREVAKEALVSLRAFVESSGQKFVLEDLE